MVKVYEAKRFDELQIRLNYCGQSLVVKFSGADARHRASFTTNNLFVQDALERDPRFGSLFVLVRKYNDDSAKNVEAAEKAPKKIVKVKTVNDALRWFTEAGFAPTGEEDITSLCEKANVEFPNLRR